MESLELLSSLSLVVNEDVMQRSGKHVCVPNLWENVAGNKLEMSSYFLSLVK